MKNKYFYLVILAAVMAVLTWNIHLASATEPDISTYTSLPIFLTSSAPPNVLVILDNSGSMNARAYANQAFDPSKTYYGYFANGKYSYASGVFTRNAGGSWDGNFLNWVAMRRIDVVRKVLMGGLATSRQGGGNQVNIGESSASDWDIIYSSAYTDPPSYTYDTTFKVPAAVASTVSPYGSDLYFGLHGGYFYLDTDTTHIFYPSPADWTAQFTIKVQKDWTYADEKDDFVDGNISGVLQKVGDRARWGLEFFNFGTGKGQDGGYIAKEIGSNMADYVTAAQNNPADTWTPLAEALYVGMQYYRQKTVDDLEVNGASIAAFYHTYPNGATLIQANTTDPFRFGGGECAKNFILILTDGQSTMDQNIPAELKDYDNDSNDDYTGTYTGSFGGSTTTSLSYGNSGSNYLDDIALFARTNDLRSDIDDMQTIYLYCVYAFGDQNFEDSKKAKRDLMDAAKNGGFEDKNNNKIPDLTEEWDLDNDGEPDTFYNASDGAELEAQLLRAITDILKRASSGTAVSVLATSSEGEGTLVQAYFKPAVTVGTKDVNWVGYLQSLWVDSLGRTREDTPPQGSKPGLVETHDEIVEFYFDESTASARFNRFKLDSQGNKKIIGVDPNDNGILDPGETWTYDKTSHPIEELRAIWEAGELLHTRTAASRTIYTFVDSNNDGELQNLPAQPHNEFISFDIGNADKIKPFLGVKDIKWDYLGASHDAKASNLIQFIRGEDPSVLPGATVRFRTIDSNIWKLSDIVHSTPLTIGHPLDNYDLIYRDESYYEYRKQYNDRETVVYVGSNGGMLHAFYMGKYEEGDNSATSDEEQVYFDRAGTTTAGFGEELWAYVPQALLPHLKWLPFEDYTHVYYVDLKPKVVDARIFDPNDPEHPGGWGTVLICGLNMGGKYIWATDEFEEGNGSDVTRGFTSSYFAIDVTNPHAPELLWERSGTPLSVADCPNQDCFYPNLALTTSYPAVARLSTNMSLSPKDDPGKWYLIFGSGPTDYGGISNQQAHIYVVDLATGKLLRNFELADASSFMASPITVDYNLNFNVDSAYIGNRYLQGNTESGRMYRLRTSEYNSTTNTYDYHSTPANWAIEAMLDVGRPIVAPGAASVDGNGFLWIYFGTGRYFTDLDKTDTTSQYFFGVKDPYYNRWLYASDAAAAGKSPSGYDLVDVTNVAVYSDGTVGSLPLGATTFDELRAALLNKDGWYIQLGLNAVDAGERVLTKPSVLGGVVFCPTFIPNADLCGYGGNSNLLGTFYETGTAYTEEVFVGSGGSTAVNVDGQDKLQINRKVSIGVGQGSSISLHVGQQDGATGYVQQSTGIVNQLKLNPIFNVHSGFIYWRAR